jgi:hypothetical protein
MDEMTEPGVKKEQISPFSRNDGSLVIGKGKECGSPHSLPLFKRKAVISSKARNLFREAINSLDSFP